MKKTLFKRGLAVLLAILIVLPGMVSNARAAGLSGYDGHWGAKAIDRWVGEGLIEGDGSGSLDPNETMTRAHVATIFSRLLGLEKEADITDFTDVKSGAWYAGGIARCVAAGILQGAGGGSMAPERTISRAEVFTMIARALGVEESDTSTVAFTDSADIPAYARGYINALANMGAIHGTDTGAVDPRGNNTYATLSTVLDNLIGTYAGKAGTYTLSSQGITLVAADGVTLTGAASQFPVVVTKDGATVDMSGVAGASKVNVRADDVTVTGAAPGTVFDLGDSQGLTVNGEDITGTDTYTVPAQGSGSTTPSTPGTGPVGPGRPVGPSKPTEPEADLNEYGLAEDINDGTILHAWCWNFNTIKDMIPYIAAAGFSAIQTSPINSIIEGDNGGLDIVGNGKWYYHYQPTEYSEIGNYQLGTAEEFEEMCKVAHQYGVKVIVDQVINHMTASESAISDNIKNADWGDPGVMGDPEKPWTHKDSGTNWSEGDRYEETQNSLSGLIEWNTQNPKVQEYLRTWLETCVKAGADGFRYDAAKLIELPDDTSANHDVDFASEFWPTVLQNGASFQYGEVLQEGEPNHPHSGVPEVTSGYDDEDSSRLHAYQDLTFTAPDGEEKHFNTTLSFYGWRLRDAVSEGNLDADYVGDMLVPKGASAARTVTWVESHDSYMNDHSYNELDEQQVIEAYAILASRKDGTPLFFSRPMNATAGNPNGNNKIGPEGSHFFMDSQVVAVNFFHNEMAGKEEYISNPTGSDKVVMIERGNAGAVIVNIMDEDLVLDGAPVQNMADGTYTDQAYGGTFTVKNGKISGTVKAGRVAVVYNSKVDSELEFAPEITLSVPTSDFLTDSVTVSVSIRGVDHAEYTVDGGEAKTIKNGDTVTVGAGLAADESVTLTVTGYDKDGKEVATASATYTKRLYRADTIVYVSDAVRASHNWNEIYIYTWHTENSVTVQNSGWPGERATLQTEGEWAGYWKYVLPFACESLENNHVIVHGNASGQIERDDMLINPGETKVMLADESWVDPASATKPTVAAAPGSTMFDETIEITLYASNVAKATYQIGSEEAKPYTNGTKITIGAGMEKGDSVKLVLTGYDEQGQPIEGVKAEYTYQRSNYKGITTVYVDPNVHPEWTEMAVYFWYTGQTEPTPWPGFQLTEKNADGYYVFRLPQAQQGYSWNVILNNNVKDGGTQDGDRLINPDEQKLITADGQWVDYVPNTDIYVAEGYLKAKGWNTVYTYIYGEHENAGWPGVVMEKVEEGDWAGYWHYRLPAEDYKDTTNNNVILNNGGNGNGNQYDAGSIAWGETKVMTAGGEWMDASELLAYNVSAYPVTGTEFYAEELEVTLHTSNVTNATYSVDGADPVSYTDGTTITVGKTTKDGETVTLTLTGESEAVGEVTATYTYTKRFVDTEEATKNVLFIGNSYTFYNGGVWSHFQKMAYDAGHNVNVDSVTNGSHTLTKFNDPNDDYGKKVQEKLNGSVKYDVVFLQENSLTPLTDYEAFETAAKGLAKKFTDKFPDVQIILYQTWGRHSESTNLTQNGRGWTNETMTWDLEAAYEKAAAEIEGAEVSPVGTAFHDVYANNGDKVDIYDNDKTHPKLPGTYLAALTHLQTVYGADIVDKVDSYDAGLDKDVVSIIKDAVKAAPKNSLVPHVYATPADSNSLSFTTPTLTVTLHAVNTTSATYTLNDGEATSFNHLQTVDIGSGESSGTFTFKLNGVSGDKTDEQTVTYTKAVSVPYTNDTTITIDPKVKPDWEDFCIYVYSGETKNGNYPGAQQESLTKNADGTFTYKLPDNLQGKLCKVIFSDGGDDSTKVENLLSSGENITISPDEHRLWGPSEDEDTDWVWKENRKTTLIVGWYAKTETSGLDQAAVDTIRSNLLTWLKTEKKYTDEQCSAVIFRAYYGNVGPMGQAVNADGDVNVMIGVGTNFQDTGKVTCTRLSSNNITCGSKNNRCVAQITDDELSKAVYDWFVATYGPKT